MHYKLCTSHGKVFVHYKWSISCHPFFLWRITSQLTWHNSPISLFPRLSRSSKQMISTAPSSPHLRSKRSTRVHLKKSKRDIITKLTFLSVQYSFFLQKGCPTKPYATMPKGIIWAMRFMVLDWGFTCFSDIERNSTNKWIYAFSFLVGKTVSLNQSTPNSFNP